VAQVWPLIRRELSDGVTLTLVGFDPPDTIRALGKEEGVRVVANAPELRPHYDHASLVIVPLLAGSGTRIKVLEAASFGRAIVTTALGCEGLDFVDGRHAAIADRPESFAAAVVRLAKDPAARAALAATALAHVTSRFSAEAIQAGMIEKIRALPAFKDAAA
jgi:glycosyltransferase involved in cell wall biosynthesis